MTDVCVRSPGWSTRRAPIARVHAVPLERADEDDTSRDLHVSTPRQRPKPARERAHSDQDDGPDQQAPQWPERTKRAQRRPRDGGHDGQPPQMGCVGGERRPTAAAHNAKPDMISAPFGAAIEQL